MAQPHTVQFTKDFTRDALQNELQVCKRRLDSKVEALYIVSRELDHCRTERDQFKLMAEQLRERYQSLKWQVSGKSPMPECGLDPKLKRQLDTGENSALSLYRAKEANKNLQFEVDDLKQKLSDADGDVKLLREQIARQRVGTSDEGMYTRYFPAHERVQLVKQLEASQEQCVQLERDLQQVIDEKEEQETERDAFKHKYERLNRELNHILKGDENRILDLDALVNENKYLSDRVKQTDIEKSAALASVSKYKNLLEKRKSSTKGILKLGQSRQTGFVISQKQVHQLLENEAGMTNTPQTVADLQGLSKALLDSLTDKKVALSHQKKTNKILGTRVSELEKQLKTLEVGGFWNIPAQQYATLEKLKSECSDIKSLIPDQQSSSGHTNEETASDNETLADIASSRSVTEEPTREEESGRRHLSMSESDRLLADLDMLPTRDTLRDDSLGTLDIENDDATSENESESKLTCEDKSISATYISANEDLESEFQSLLGSATAKVTSKQGENPPRKKRSQSSFDDDEDSAGFLS